MDNLPTLAEWWADVVLNLPERIESYVRLMLVLACEAVMVLLFWQAVFEVRDGKANRRTVGKVGVGLVALAAAVLFLLSYVDYVQRAYPEMMPSRIEANGQANHPVRSGR